MIRVVFLLSSILFVFNAFSAEKKYIGVVDVGSTGARLHVYAQSDHATPMEEVWVKKITPGFSSLKPEQAYIDNYLNELFQAAPRNFPVYFYATAGMRLLPSEEQNKYYDAVRAWFKRSAWNLQEAKTITGREEGVFAWLSLYEKLNEKSDIEVPQHLSVMDMGGASVQVVSAVDSKIEANQKDYIEVNLHGKSQTLFVHSFLGLGKTSVSEQFLDEPSCFSDGYPLPDGSLGAGNATRCVEHISKLIDGVHDVHRTLHPALDAAEVKNWYVMAGLAYLIEEAPFNQNQHEITNDALLQQADRAVCHRPWHALQSAYPDDKYLSRACLAASYYYALMRAYDIKPSEPIHLVSNSTSTDWTLGVALHNG
ncbi:MAG: multidrug DMT transporter permease [Legionella sp.]|nr:multidrug DMT transporter permease [Legionella sp.]